LHMSWRHCAGHWLLLLHLPVHHRHLLVLHTITLHHWLWRLPILILHHLGLHLPCLVLRHHFLILRNWRLLPHHSCPSLHLFIFHHHH